MNTRLIAFFAAACIGSVALAQTGTTGTTGQTGQTNPTGQTGTMQTDKNRSTTDMQQNRSTTDPQSRGNRTDNNANNRNNPNNQNNTDCVDKGADPDLNSSRTRNGNTVACNNTNPRAPDTRKNTDPGQVR